MGLDKSEVKLAILHDLGCKMDDMLEGVQHEKYRAEGASRALVQATKAVRQLAGLVDDDLDKERYDLPTAAKIKEYLDRAATIVESMAKNAANQQVAGGGRAAAMDMVVKYLKKEHDQEETKKKALIAAIEGDDEDEAEPRPHERVVGQRPPPPIKQRRLVEEPEPESKPPPIPAALIPTPKPKKTMSLKDRLMKRSKSDYAKDS